MPKRKRGIAGDAASRREAIRKRERRVVETEEERSRRLQLWHNVARTEEWKEQKNKEIADWNDALFEIARATPGHTARLSDMAQRGQEKRAEETEEQRNRRLAVKGQRSQHIRAEETEE
ncbi:hypothetical protein AVEN_14255-1 [Araneus ventricosus]|uniref:Uncharacterized protein n=1 Tax=Araneus ventricosus TaxID=182803 RepID=A0A4Y2GIR5_ARAVE|nr:hypothetical protein AVEN_14255-1 [Araneus ventricosus]